MTTFKVEMHLVFDDSKLPCSTLELGEALDNLMEYLVEVDEDIFPIVAASIKNFSCIESIHPEPCMNGSCKCKFHTFSRNEDVIPWE